jgi:hypothetical protein
MFSGQFHNYLPSCQIYPQSPYVHCSLQLHGVWQLARFISEVSIHWRRVHIYQNIHITLVFRINNT